MSLSGLDLRFREAILPCFNDLASVQTRTQGSLALAKEIGVSAFLVLVADPEVGSLRPALGFPQSLPGGPSWTELLRQCASVGDVMGEVAYPDKTTLVSFVGIVDPSKAVALFIGGRPTITPRELLADFPFLVPLLIAELQAATAQNRAEAATSAETRTAKLSLALERSLGRCSLDAPLNCSDPLRKPQYSMKNSRY